MTRQVSSKEDIFKKLGVKVDIPTEKGNQVISFDAYMLRAERLKALDEGKQSNVPTSSLDDMNSDYYFTIQPLKVDCPIHGTMSGYHCMFDCNYFIELDTQALDITCAPRLGDS